MTKRFLSSLFLLFSMLSVVGLAHAQGGIFRTTFDAQGYTLSLELLDNDLVHFAVNAAGNTQEPLWTTPMVKTDTAYPGPSQVNLIATNLLETPDMRLEIDQATLCITVTDLTRDPDLLLTTLCPLSDDGELVGLSMTKEGTTDIYGLGEQFQRRGGTEGNWFGRRRNVLNPYGNELMSFNGGNVGNAQFPIMYALGAGTDNYALFLDDVYQQLWDFSGDLFTVRTTNTIVRGYIMTGPDLADLRRDYMELTGTPPVPPKQMFGLWVSEYGYDNWAELEGVLESMQEAGFPQDGFVLDLQWFGGINPPSQMGSLAWDTENFPDPAAYIARLREEYGLGIMTIEEPYVSNKLTDYETVTAEGALVRKCEEETCEPAKFVAWWGTGGMVDFTNPDAAAWWHDNRRAHLIDEGVMGHWTDLGEPEIFGPTSWYYGFPEIGWDGLHAHADIHNLYNFLWSQSIWEAYQRNGVIQRPFIVSRSGTSGSQRFGVAMWSGDIAANMPSLEAHMNVQMHMSLSGIDYFGSDVGGFYRQAADLKISKEDMYTVWLANSSLLDVPLRPHTSNVQNQFQTAPSLMGDVPSNLANVRLRYELSPYLYTLAHRAYRNAEPVFAPLVYYFQDDPNVRTLGGQKMIGPDLMMAVIKGADIDTVSVYLPAGGWFDYHTGEFIESGGEWIDVPTLVDGVRRAPLFVRDGAIIPQMKIDDQTMNVLGQRRDGSTDETLLLSVYYASETKSTSVIDDDGTTMAYQDGDFWQTTVTATEDETGMTVTIGAQETTFEAAPNGRPVEIRLISPNADVGSVLLNDAELPAAESMEAFAENDQGWIVDDVGVVHVKSGVMDVTQEMVFTFKA